jgi:hypothetical protein
MLIDCRVLFDRVLGPNHTTSVVFLNNSCQTKDKIDSNNWQLGSHPFFELKAHLLPAAVAGAFGRSCNRDSDIGQSYTHAQSAIRPVSPWALSTSSKMVGGKCCCDPGLGHGLAIQLLLESVCAQLQL